MQVKLEEHQAATWPGFLHRQMGLILWAEIQPTWGAARAVRLPAQRGRTPATEVCANAIFAQQPDRV